MDTHEFLITPEENFSLIGMTNISRRDYFAAAALTGIIASFSGHMPIPKPRDAAEKALQYADALIERMEEK